MIYLIWSLPTLIVIAAIASGRVNTTYAALLGLLAAAAVALFSGPNPQFGTGQLSSALVRGAWIGLTIAPYILGGLLFWQIAAHRSASDSLAVPETVRGNAIEQRRLLFFSCFLVGPFAESATGFGVGMLGTVALIRHLGIAPRYLMIFALMSQTFIPWGAMGSGTMLAAAYTRMPPSQLALYSIPLVALLMLVWLPLFWRTATSAGLPAPATECAREAGWIVASLALLTATTFYLGPETALLAAFGPLIVLRYLLDQHPDRKQLLTTAKRVLPYVVLIGALVMTRLLPGLKHLLEAIGRMAPFADLPAWSPLFHAGSWLVAGGIITAILRGQRRILGKELLAAWLTGKNAVLTVFLFAMMAEVLSAAGISQSFATVMFASLNDKAILFTPVLSSIFGIISNSGNAPNSLFMPSQLALAIQAGLSVLAVAAIQHVSGTSMSLFSPVRMSIAAGLSNGRGQERGAYVLLIPYALTGVTLLTLAAVAVMSFR